MKNVTSTPASSSAASGLDASKSAKDIAGVTAEIRKLYPPLDAAATRGTSKIKPGAEDFTALVISLARKEGIQVNGHGLDDIEGALSQSKQLKELRTSVAGLLQVVSSAILTCEGKTWSGANLYYSILTRIARTNPELLAALEPGRALHKRRSKSVKTEQMIARAERKAANAALKATEEQKKTEVVKARVAAAAESPKAEPAPTPAAPASLTTGATGTHQ